MSLFRAENTPHPPSFNERIARANEGLRRQGVPEHVRVAYRGRLKGGAYNPKPWRVLIHDRDVCGASSLEAVLFIALRERVEARRREALQQLFRSPYNG